MVVVNGGDDDDATTAATDQKLAGANARSFWLAVRTRPGILYIPYVYVIVVVISLYWMISFSWVCECVVVFVFPLNFSRKLHLAQRNLLPVSLPKCIANFNEKFRNFNACLCFVFCRHSSSASSSGFR